MNVGEIYKKVADRLQELGHSEGTVNGFNEAAESHKELTIEEAVEWFLEKPDTRSIDLKLKGGRWAGVPEIELWAYDYELAQGEHPKRMADVDLEGKHEKELYEQFKKLEGKFKDKK